MGVHYHPAREVGGDLYDFEWDSRTLQVVVGDVSGKSIPAALYGAVFSGQLRALFPGAPTPSEALEFLNNNLVARYRSGNYIAVEYCRVDLGSGRGTLANGGMPFPFLIRASAVTRLEISGVPLGLLEGTSYEELEFQLEPGDTLILASDGTTDALNTDGEFYDVERFTESVRRHAAEETSECLKNLDWELRQFIGGADLSDDVTIIALRRRK
jgi:sigma-B regulation protein RsbU (phosphoserine phosphatase)